MPAIIELQEFLDYLQKEAGDPTLNWVNIIGLNESDFRLHQNKYKCIGVSERVLPEKGKTSKDRAAEILNKLKSTYPKFGEDDISIRSSDGINYRVFISDQFILKATENFQIEKRCKALTDRLSDISSYEDNVLKEQVNYELKQAAKELIEFVDYINKQRDETWLKANSKVIESIVNNQHIINLVNKGSNIKPDYEKLLKIASENNPNFRVSDRLKTTTSPEVQSTKHEPIVHAFKSETITNTSIPVQRSEKQQLTSEQLLEELVNISNNNGGMLDEKTIAKCMSDPSFTANIMNAIGEGLTKELNNPNMHSKATQICGIFQNIYLKGGKLAENMNASLDNVAKKQIEKFPDRLKEVLLTTQMYRDLMKETKGNKLK